MTTDVDWLEIVEIVDIVVVGVPAGALVAPPP